MDELDLYEDLDEFQEQQEQKSKEIKEVEEKYQQSLKTIEGLREENKNLKKNIQQIELGFQSLLDTARAEINRKNKEIERLRKEKDDICFRRKIPQNVASESEKQESVHNPFRFNTTPDYEISLKKINSKTNANHTDKEEIPESNKRYRHHDEEERSNSTDYKRHRIARDEQNAKYRHNSHKIDKKSCSKIEDNHRGSREKDKDSMYRKDHNRNHSRGRKDYDKSNSRNTHRDFRKSSESPERKIYHNEQKFNGRCRSREGKNSAIFTRTSSKSPTPKIKPNRDTNRDNYYHERSSRKKTKNEKSHKTVDDLGELKSKVFEGAKKPINTKNSQREIDNVPNSKHNLEPSTRCDQQISQNSTIVHQEKIQSVKELTKESETKQTLIQSSISNTREICTPRKVALYNEIFGKSPSESGKTASSNILLNSIKSILDKTSQIEVISSATTSPGDYTDISSCTSTPLRNAINIISSIKTSSDSTIMEVNKDKSMTKKTLGDTSEIDSCFIPTQQNLEQNIKSVAYIDLTEVVNDDIASELEYVQIPGLDLCLRDGNSTIKNKNITTADIEENEKLNEGQIANSSKKNKISTCGKEWTQKINNESKTKSNKFLETFHSISDNEIEKEQSISTEKELLNKVPNAIRKEVPTTDVLIISPLKQNTNISKISSIKKKSSHENTEKLINITKNLANEVVVIENLKSTTIPLKNPDIIDVDLIRNDKHCLDKEEYNTSKPIQTFLDNNEESKKEINNRKITEHNEIVGFDKSMHTGSVTDETRSNDRSKCETAAIKIPLVVSSIASSLPEKSICHSVAFDNFDISVKSLELISNSEEQTELLSSTQNNSKVVQSEKQNLAENLLNSAYIFNTVDNETRVIDKSQFADKNLLVKSHIKEKFVEKEVLESKKLTTEKSDNQNLREIEVGMEKQSDTVVSCNLSKSESVEVVQSKELNKSENDFHAIEKEKPDVKIPVNLLPEKFIINMENVCESYFEDNLGDNEAVGKVRQFESGAINELSRQEVVQIINENIFSSIEQENSTAFTEISTKTDKANENDKIVAQITNPDISEKLYNNTETSTSTKSSTEEPSIERESNIQCTLDEAKEKACQKPVEDKIYTENIHENDQKNTQHLSLFKDKCTTSFTREKLLTSINGFENETSTKDLIHEKSNERKVITDDLSSNDKEYASNSNNESKLISSVTSKNIDLILDSCDSTANKVESLQKPISSTLKEKTNSHEKDETKTKPSILDSHIPSTEEKITQINETKTQLNDMENILDKKVENFKNETSLHTNIERSSVNIEELHANNTVTPIAGASVKTTDIPDAFNSNEKQKSLTSKIANEQAALELHKISENLETSSRNDEKIVSSADNSNHKQELISTDTSLEIKPIQHSLNNAESPVKLCNSKTVFGTNPEDKAELEFIDLEESEIKEREPYSKTQENIKHTESDDFNITKDSQIIFIVNEGDESSQFSESKDLEHSPNTQETLKLFTNKSGNSIETKTKTNLKINVKTSEAVSDENNVSDQISTEFNIEHKLNNSEVKTGNDSTNPSKNNIRSLVFESTVEKAHDVVIKDQTPNDTALYQSVEINQDLEHLEKNESDNDKKEIKSKQGSENHSTSMPETSTDIRISNRPEDAISSHHSIILIQQTSVESTKEKDEQTLKLKECLQTQKLMLSHNIESEIKDNESKCDSTTSIKQNDILVKLTAQLSNNKNEIVREVLGTSIKLTEQLPNNVKEGPDSHVSESLYKETSKVLQQDIDNNPIRSSETTYNDDDLKTGNSKNNLGKFLSNPSLPSLQDNSNHKEESLTTDASLEIKTIKLSQNNAECPVKLSNSITVFRTNQEDKAELEFVDLEESKKNERESYNRTHGNSENQKNIKHSDSDHLYKTRDSQTGFIVDEEDASSIVIESKGLENSSNKLKKFKKSINQETLKLSPHKSGNSDEAKTKTALKNDVDTKPVCTLVSVTEKNDVSDLIPTEFNIENKLNNSEVETGNDSTNPAKNDIRSLVFKSAVEKAHVVVIKDQTPNDTALYQSVEINQDIQHLEKNESDNDKKEIKSKQGAENHSISMPETDIRISNRPEDAISSHHSIILIQQTSVESTKEKDEQTLKLKECLQTQKLMLSHNIESEIKDNESKCDSTTSIKQNDILVKLTAQLSNNKNEIVREVLGTSIKLTEQLPNNVKEGPDSHVSESLYKETSKVLQHDIDNNPIRSSETTYNDDDLKTGNSKNKLGKFLSNPSLPSLQDNSNHKEESLTTDASLEIKTIKLSQNNAECLLKLSNSITVFRTNQEDKAELEFVDLEESKKNERESYNRTHGNSENQKNIKHSDSDHLYKTRDSQTGFIVDEEDASSIVIESKGLENSSNKLKKFKKSINQETLKLSPHKSGNSDEAKTKTALKNDVDTKPVCTLVSVTEKNDVSDLIPTEFNIENKLNNSEVETGNDSTNPAKNDIRSLVFKSAVEKAHVVVIKDQTPNDTALYQSVEINQDIQHLEKNESDNDKKEIKSKQGAENHSISMPETDIRISNRPEDAISSHHSIILIQETSVESTKEKDEQSLNLKECLQAQKLMLSHNIESEIKDNKSKCDSTTSIKQNDKLVKLTAQLSNNKNERAQEVSGTSMKLTEQLPNNDKEGPDSHVSASLNEETSKVLQQDIDNNDLKIDNSNSKILAVKTLNRPQETEFNIKNIIVNHESAKNKTICDLFKGPEERSIHSSLQVEANAIERPVKIETLTLNCGPGSKTVDTLKQTKAINANEIERLDHKDLFNVANISESSCLEKSTNISDEVKRTDYAFKENNSDNSLLNNNCIFNEKQTKSQAVHITNKETNKHEVVSNVCKIIPPLVYWNINKVGMETQEKDFHQNRINRPINIITQKCKQIRTKEINIEGKIIEVVKILADESHIINKNIEMSKQSTDNLTRTKCFINEIEQQTQNSATKSNNLNIGTCDYNHGIPVAKSTIPNEYLEMEEIESKNSRTLKEIEENQYQTPKKVQTASVDHQIKDIPLPSKEELPTASTMLPETFGTHPILPSISTTSPTPSNFSGIFSKKSSSSVITEDDFNKPKKKSPHLSGKPKEYILPAASVLCNVDNLEYATKVNKKLHWELLENKNEMTEIEDDVDIDTTDEEQLKIKEEPLENASSSPKNTSLQTKLLNRMSQKSSPSETDTQTEDESLLNDLKEQKEKHRKIRLSKVHKTKQRKNNKLPKTVRARLQAIGMSSVDTFVDSSGLIKQKSVSINLPKRKVGRPRKAENRGAFAEHHKKRGRKPKPKENKSQQEIARNTTFRCKLVNCKKSKIVENKSLDRIDVINNLENSVKILSTSVERLEICDEPCTSRESVKQNKSSEKPFKDNINKDIYNALLIYKKEDSLTDNVNKSIIEKSSSVCNNELQENNFCDFTDKGNVSTETVSLIKLPKVSKTSKETEESNMIEINNCEKANVHSDKPKEDRSSSRETQNNRLVHKSDKETDKVFSEKKSFKTKSSSSEETQDNPLSNKSNTETDDGLTEDHDQELKKKKTFKTILKPIIKKKFKSKPHKNRVTNFISLEDIGIKARPLKGHLSSFRIPKIKKDGEDKIDKSWKLETYIDLENEGISKELKEQSEHKRESAKILHDNISTDTSIKDRRLNIKKHAEEIEDNSSKLKASTEIEAGRVQNHIDNGKEGSKEQNRTDCCSSKEQVTGRHMKLTDKKFKKEEEQHNTNPKQIKNEEKISPSNYTIKFDNKTNTGKRKLFSTEMYDERDAEEQVEVAAENKHTEIINKQNLNLSKTDEPTSNQFRKYLHLPSQERSFSNKSIKSRRKLIEHRRIFDSSSDEDNDKKPISDKPMLNEFTNTQIFKSSANLETSLKEHSVSSALNRKESKKSIGVRKKSVDVEKSTLKEVENNKIDESSAANSIQPLEQQSNIENSELNENKVQQSFTKNSTVVGVEDEQNKTDRLNKNICNLKLAANQNSCIINKKLSKNSKKDNNVQQQSTQAIKSDKLRRKSMYVESKSLKLSSPELEKVTEKPITHANIEHWNGKEIKSLDLDQDVYLNRNTNLESPEPVINTCAQAKPKASLKIRRKSMYVEKTSLFIEEDKKYTKDLLEGETRSTNNDNIQQINSELSGTNVSVQQHTIKMQRKSTTTQQNKSVSKHVEENAEDSIKAPIKAKKHLISEKKVENNIDNSKNTDKGSDSVVKLTQQISIKMRRKPTNQVVNKDFDEFNKFTQKAEQNTKELVLNVDNNQTMEHEFDSSVAVQHNESIKTNRKCANQRNIYDPEIPDQILSNTGEVKKDSDTKELKNKTGKISTPTDKGPVFAASTVAANEKSIKMRRKSTTQRQITNSIIIKQDNEVHSDIVNKSEQQPLEILRNKDHSPQMISTPDSSPVLIQAKKNRRKSTNYHEDSSNVLKGNPENHKAADSEVSISLTQRNQEMEKNADQLKTSKEKFKDLLNQETGNTIKSLNTFREKIQETHEEATLKSNGGHDKDCNSNTSVVLKQQKSFEIRRKSTNHRRILDSSSDDEPLIKKPTVTPIKVKTALTTTAKQKQRKRRVVKVLSTSMESPADVTNTSQQFDCQPSSFTSPTLNHPIFNTEVSTQSSEFVASLPVTPNQQDDNKFKEIDSKLHEIFQSPQYAVDYKTSPTVAAANLINLPPPLNDANITIDETHYFNEENYQSCLNVSQINASTVTLKETTAIHNKSEVKHLSLGSAEYRFEKVSDNVINLFISRKRKRKRNN